MSRHCHSRHHELGHAGANDALTLAKYLHHYRKTSLRIALCWRLSFLYRSRHHHRGPSRYFAASPALRGTGQVADLRRWRRALWLVLWPRENNRCYHPSHRPPRLHEDLSRNSSRWEPMLSALPHSDDDFIEGWLCQLNQSMQNCINNAGLTGRFGLTLLRRNTTARVVTRGLHLTPSLILRRAYRSGATFGASSFSRTG